MKVGIKVGFQDGIHILKQSQAEYCEVWFRLDWEEKYYPLFEYLNKNKIAFGLHFWAMVNGKYFPSLLNRNKNIAQETFVLIKQTIDIAYKWQAKYVNFHPESYRLMLLNLDKSTMKVVDENEPIDRDKSFQQLTYFLGKIKNYSEKKGIVSFIETVPKYSPSDYKDLELGRGKPQLSEGLETEKYYQLAKLGHPICLDIAHTADQLIIQDREKLFNYLYKSAEKMIAAIGLLHINTIMPPFNGVDSHDGVLEEDFKKGVFPNKIQLIKLMSLFKNTNVWLIPEPPLGKMVANYYALKEIIMSISK